MAGATGPTATGAGFGLLPQFRIGLKSGLALKSPPKPKNPYGSIGNSFELTATLHGLSRKRHSRSVLLVGRRMVRLRRSFVKPRREELLRTFVVVGPVDNGDKPR